MGRRRKQGAVSGEGLQGRENACRIEQKFPGRDSSKSNAGRAARRTRAQVPIVEAVELPEPMTPVRAEVFSSVLATLVAGVIREGLERGTFFVDAGGVVRCSDAASLVPAQKEGNL